MPRKCKNAKRYASAGSSIAATTLNSLNLPLYMTRTLGGNERDVGLAYAISPLFEMVFMIGFGHLASRGHQLSIMVLEVVARPA
jgi:hypothetical protein